MKLKVLEQAGIPILKARSDEDISSAISELPRHHQVRNANVAVIFCFTENGDIQGRKLRAELKKAMWADKPAFCAENGAIRGPSCLNQSTGIRAPGRISERTVGIRGQSGKFVSVQTSFAFSIVYECGGKL